MSKSKRGFSSIVDDNSHILILGSMPGEESLRLLQYYAHPRNTFWRIIGSLFSFDYHISYENRVKELKKNNVAVWDVMKKCQREGSLDSNIKNDTIEENDFVQFFSKYLNIKYVFFNGSKAEQEFNRRVLPKLQNREKFHFEKLPSTSPAMAMLNFDQKLKHWEKIKKVLSE